MVLRLGEIIQVAQGKPIPDLEPTSSTPRGQETPLPPRSRTVPCLRHLVKLSIDPSVALHTELKAERSLFSGQAKRLFARRLYMAWHWTFGLPLSEMNAGQCLGNSAYLMQWAAVRTQFLATRDPPQVWCHWPLELNCRETWEEAWALSSPFPRAGLGKVREEAPVSGAKRKGHQGTQ